MPRKIFSHRLLHAACWQQPADPPAPSQCRPASPVRSWLRPLVLGLGLSGSLVAGEPVGWGSNHNVQLGNGFSIDASLPLASRPVPTDTSGLLNGKNVTQVAAGYYHGCALTSEGRIYCWGDNYLGELGNGSKIQSAVPVAVETSGVLSGKILTQVAAGGNYACALSSEGRAYCWGYNGHGQLGNGSWVDSSLPVAVNTNGALRGKSLSQLTAGGSTCALSSEGRAYCWGGNHWGQLGDGSTTDSNIPVAVNTNGVLSGKTVSQLTTGGAHTCLLSSHGQAYCWGWNGWGQLGSGSATAASLPVAVDSSGVLSGKTLTQVALGNNHTCALTAEGRAYCWGSNNWGQLGNGSTTSSNLPVAVDTSGALSGTRVTQIAARGDHTCALTSEGRAYCWGWNGWGQLGNGSTTSSNVPVAVDTSGILGSRNVHQISCGYAHTAALMASAGELAGLTESGQVLFTTNLSTWTQLLGTFHQLVSGDFDGNGQPDLAGLTADGSIYHSADLLTWIHIPGRLKQLLAADLDGDGHTDLAGLTADGSIYYSTDLMTWTPIPGRLKQLLAADLDGDGSADLAGLIAGQVYYSTNRLTWTRIPGRIKQLVAADLDGNGTADLAGLAPSGSIFHSTNLTSWTQVPGRLDQLLAADLDGNGTADLAGLLFMGAPNGQIYVSTDLLTWTQISGRLSQLIAGDLDGNGTADLAGLTSVGQIFYSTNRATWNQIPGTLSQLILFQ